MLFPNKSMDLVNSWGQALVAFAGLPLSGPPWGIAVVSIVAAIRAMRAAARDVEREVRDGAVPASRQSAALDAAASWAFDVGAPVDATIREMLCAAGFSS